VALGRPLAPVGRAIPMDGDETSGREARDGSNRKPKFPPDSRWLADVFPSR